MGRWSPDPLSSDDALSVVRAIALTCGQQLPELLTIYVYATRGAGTAEDTAEALRRFQANPDAGVPPELDGAEKLICRGTPEMYAAYEAWLDGLKADSLDARMDAITECLRQIETENWYKDYDTNVWLVLAVLILRTGAALPDPVRTAACAGISEWLARYRGAGMGDDVAVPVLLRLLQRVQKYQDGDAVEIRSETVMDVLEHCGSRYDVGDGPREAPRPGAAPPAAAAAGPDSLTAVVTRAQASEPQGAAASGLPSIKSVESDPKRHLPGLAVSVARDPRDATARALYRAALSAACDQFSARRARRGAAPCGLYFDVTRLDSALGTGRPALEHYALALTALDVRVICLGCEVLCDREELSERPDLTHALAQRGVLAVLVAVVMDERSLDGVLVPAALQKDAEACAAATSSIRDAVIRTLAMFVLSKRLARQIPDGLFGGVLDDYVQGGDFARTNFALADAVGLLYQNACLAPPAAQAVLRSPDIVRALDRYAFCDARALRSREDRGKLEGMRVQAAAALANLASLGAVDMALWQRLKAQLVDRLSRPPDEELRGMACATLAGFAKALPAVATQLAREGVLVPLFALQSSDPRGHTGGRAGECIRNVLENVDAADRPPWVRALPASAAPAGADAAFAVDPAYHALIRECADALALPRPADAADGPAFQTPTAYSSVNCTDLRMRCANPQCEGPAPAGPALRRCGGCRTVRYCSGACQKAHWPQHKALCKVIVAAPPGGGLVGKRVELVGLVRRADLNGAQGAVTGFDDGKAKYAVLLEDGTSIAVAEQHLRRADGPPEEGAGKGPPQTADVHGTRGEGGQGKSKRGKKKKK